MDSNIENVVHLIQESPLDETIKEILGSEELKLLQKISDQDENAKTLSQWVNSHPDITDEEYKKQIEDLKKIAKDYEDLKVDNAKIVEQLRSAEIRKKELEDEVIRLRNENERINQYRNG